MRKDYHMHPKVIQNPERVEEFVRQAVSKNIMEICITDHMPLSISSASDRLPKGTVKEYCKRVREFAKRYEGILSIKCGMEIDYHSSALDEVEAVLSEGDFDFLLASSHMHVFVKDYDRYTFNEFAAMALENSIEAAQTGWFNAITHMDMYRFAFGNAQRFPLRDDGYDPRKHMDLVDHLFDEILKKEMYLEINPHLAESKKSLEFVYPQAVFAERALARGVKFSYGSDAHKPESVGALLGELEAHPVYGIAMRQWENL